MVSGPPVRGILQGGQQVSSTIQMYAEKRGRGTILVAIESTHAPPPPPPSAAPGAAVPGFHFQLEHARVEGKPRRRLPSPCRRKKALSTRCQLIIKSSVGQCCQHFWVGWGPNRRRSCFCACDKGRTSPWQMPAGQAGAANISWSASAGRR